MNIDWAEGGPASVELKKEETASVSLKVDVEKITGHTGDLGGAFDKRAFEGRTVGMTKSREVRLVAKEVVIYDNAPDELIGYDRWWERSTAQRYVDRWCLLRKIGIPTASSMRVLDSDTVVMGNMTWGGGQFFDKAKFRRVSEELNAGISRPLTPMEKQFLEIEPEKINLEIEKNWRVAWAAGVVLPEYDEEDFGVLVNPDGSFIVGVMDLSYLGCKKAMADQWLEKAISEAKNRYLTWRMKLKAVGGIG